jgi:hypothetical protein
VAASLRLSRGFHRLGLLLAAIPMLVGVVWSAVIAVDQAKKYPEQLLCAQAALKNLSDAEVSRILPQPPSNLPPLPTGAHLDDGQLDLQKLGCSEWRQMTTYGEVVGGQPVMARSIAGSFLPISLGITLAISVALYGVIRAIGWVIGGFAAS